MAPSQAALRESLGRWEADFAEYGESEEDLVEFLEAQVRDHELGAFYARLARLARQRYGRPGQNLSRAQTSLPATRARESRPRRRAAKALAGGDDDPEPEPLDGAAA